MPNRLLVPAALAALLIAPAARGETFALRVGVLHTAEGPPVRDALLVVADGKVLAAGPFAGVGLPPGVKPRELPEAVVIPGLVDAHSHLGVYSRPGVPANSDGNEMSGPVQPGLRAVDAVNADDPGIRMGLAGGITTANVMPGSGNVIGGQTVYVKLRGRTIEEMRIVDDATLGGLKMANGENPKGYGRSKSQAPFTRMKVAQLQREQFVKAREYRAKWAAHREQLAAGKTPTPPERDLNLEPLVEVLERKRTVHFHCHRADDLMSAVRIADEFGFDLVLQHGSEGYRVSKELAEKKIPVSLTVLDSAGGKAEAMGMLLECAAALEKAGVVVGVNTDDPVTESRFLLRTAALTVRGGMSEDAALRAVTLNPAKMLRLDRRVGSLKGGKDADFVVLSGAPFSAYTQVLETYIDGKKVFDRAVKADAAYSTGGFALPAARQPEPAPRVAPLPTVAAPAVARVDAGEPDAAPKRRAIVAGRVHTAAGEPIRDGAILIEDGRIVAVGPRAEVKIPPGTPVLTAAEVTPGLIDAHSVVGLSGAFNTPADQDQDERSDPVQPELRVLDGFNPDEPLLEFLRSEGVTLLHAVPGPVNVLAGQTGVFRTRGRTAEAMAVRFPVAVLANLGEVPKAAYPGRAPTTRMATAQLIRAQLQAAREYAAKRAAAEKDKPVPMSLEHEAMTPILAKKLFLMASAHRSDDILTVIRVGREFDIPVLLTGGTEGYLVADQIADAKMSVVVHPTLQRAGGSMETLHSHVGNARLLADRGIPVAIGTSFEGYVPKTRVLRNEMSAAMAAGLGHARALRAVTLEPAKFLGVADKYGSIEVGKAADLVLYDGDPFEHATHVTHTLMDGRTAFDRAEYLRLPLERRMLPVSAAGGVGCCLGW